MSSGRRKLAAIMFTDMVGYTALGQRNESLSLALAEEQRKIIRPILLKHHGREVKTIGDAFLVEFLSSLDAVRCAYDIQRAIREFNVGMAEDRRVHLRVGIHLGDVVESRGDISGDTVNVASRVEPLAEDGGVCLTRQVYDQVQNKFQLELASLGTRSLKNVAVPVEVFRMVMPWTEKEAPPHALLDKNRVAVLPFTNMSPDPNDEYFADGMTEELISTISRIAGLKVIARTSVMGYKGGHRKIRDIADELGASSILEGSVRKAGDKLRITVQLIDSKSAEYSWSETYDRSFSDIFAIQTDIARNVAEALKVRLAARRNEQNQTGSTGNTEAYTHYLRGRYFWNQRELDGFNRAVKEFETALKLDPRFALAYAGLADTHLLMGRNGQVMPRVAYPKAIENAQKAISLDSRLADPLVTMAAIKQEYQWKWEESERDFKDAILLNPSNPIAHSWYALYLGHVGRFDEGIKEAMIGQELDPLSPRAHGAASEQYLFARQYDKSIEAAEKALEISPGFGGGYGFRGYSRVEMGMYDEAISDFQEAGKHYGARAVMGRLGHAYALAGKRNEAEKILNEFAKEPAPIPARNPFMASPPDTAFDSGLVCLGLGEMEKAIGFFDKAVEEKTAEVIHFKCEPIYDPIRRMSKFKALIAKMGLDKT